MTAYTDAMDRLEKKFAEIRGCPPPDWKKNKRAIQRTWRSPLNRIWEACLKNTEFAEKALELAAVQMMRDKLTWWAPCSVEKVALSLIYGGKVRTSKPSSYSKADIAEARRKAAMEEIPF